MPAPVAAISQKPAIADWLNAALRSELTAINQYFLHARILKHQGNLKLADIEYKKSIDVMRHADRLVERVLALGGMPNMQDIGKPMIGENPEAIIKNDLSLARCASEQLRSGIALCEAERDAASAEILRAILASKEEHIAFLNTNPHL